MTTDLTKLWFLDQCIAAESFMRISWK